jgi:signal transduction histidine kinase
MSARSYAHIQIVEDDPGIATSLRSGLEREGYQVTWVDKGEDGIAFAQNQAPDLIILEIESDPVNIKGDAAQLGTLIQNLLDNAIKFTPAGGQVNVKLSTQNEAVQLSVADTGIPEEDIPHLFSRFHRGRNASAYPGSGLGLAIVKAIADQHGAKIEVKRKSIGTVFVIRFIPYQSGS